MWYWLTKLDKLKSWSRNAWLHRFPGKWKYQKIVYMQLIKLPFEATISAKHLFIRYIHLKINYHWPTFINGFFIFCPTFYDILVNNLTLFTFDNSGPAVLTSPKVWTFGKTILVWQYLSYLFIMWRDIVSKTSSSFKMFLFYISLMVLFCMQ